MILHPYDRKGIRSLVAGHEAVMESVNSKGEQIVVIKVSDKGDLHAAF